MQQGAGISRSAGVCPASAAIQLFSSRSSWVKPGPLGCWPSRKPGLVPKTLCLYKQLLAALRGCSMSFTAVTLGGITVESAVHACIAARICLQSPVTCIQRRSSAEMQRGTLGTHKLLCGPLCGSLALIQSCSLVFWEFGHDKAWPIP